VANNPDPTNELTEAIVKAREAFGDRQLAHALFMAADHIRREADERAMQVAARDR